MVAGVGFVVAVVLVEVGAGVVVPLGERLGRTMDKNYLELQHYR
jgi:hypothetical protein